MSSSHEWEEREIINRLEARIEELEAFVRPFAESAHDIDCDVDHLACTCPVEPARKLMAHELDADGYLATPSVGTHCSAPSDHRMQLGSATPPPCRPEPNSEQTASTASVGDVWTDEDAATVDKRAREIGEIMTTPKRSDAT